ncbi:MAG: hypothetical protein AAGG02_13220 [Cyanobacteria bacterium P01_H01_bin.15]
MEYLYHLANASLVLRIITRLQSFQALSPFTLTVIHQINGWVVKVKFDQALDTQVKGDLNAYFNELGIPYEPDMRLQMVFWSLDAGQSLVAVMRRYQVAVVSHGSPDISDIESFRSQFAKGLGYCPETLA